MGKRTTSATQTAVAAIEALASAHPDMPPGFPKLLYGRTVAEDLSSVPAELLARTAAEAYAFLTAPRPADTIRLHLRDDAYEADGAQRQITILEVLNDNKAFLLDSTLA